MGSSELTSEDVNYTKSFNFIPYYTDFDVLAIGHAGNQSFSIFSQLLNANEYLKGSKIVIIISPTWLINKYSSGTSIASFLEFNNDRFLINIANDPNINYKYKNYIGQFIYTNYQHVDSPNNGIKTLYYSNLSNRNIINEIAYSPVLWILKLLNNYSVSYMNNINKNSLFINQKSTEIEAFNINGNNISYSINWDSLFHSSIDYQKSLSTNNTWGINNNIYSSITKKRGNKRRVLVKNKRENQEFKDMMMLLDLLDYYKTNPIFIIQSLNPYAYEDLCLLKPIIDEIINNLNDYNFPVLNQFICYEDEYEIGMLTDAMHMGDLGWHKVNKFIIENYIINE